MRLRVRVEDDGGVVVGGRLGPSLTRLLLLVLVEPLDFSLELGVGRALEEELREELAAVLVGLAVALDVAPLGRGRALLRREAVVGVHQRMQPLLLFGKVLVVLLHLRGLVLPHLTRDLRDQAMVVFEAPEFALLVSAVQDVGIARTRDMAGVLGGATRDGLLGWRRVG